MSLASGESKSTGSKKSWWPLSWGARFTIALTGTVVLWWWITNWMRSSQVWTAHTAWGGIWIFLKLFLVPLLCLLFLIGTVKLLWEQRFFLVQWLRLTNKQQGLFTAIFIAGTVLTLGIYHMAQTLSPFQAMRLYSVSYFAFLVAWISTFCWISLRNGQLEVQPQSEAAEVGEGRTAGLRRWWSVRENRLSSLSLFIILLAFATPGRLVENLAWSVGLVIAYQVYLRRYGWVVSLATHGRYGGALWLDRACLWLPGSGSSLKGFILLEAGRNREAQACTRRMALDESGKPLFANYEFYYYTQALSNGGGESEAQPLFEAAIQLPQTSPHFHVGLVVCLLDQKKDESRALELMEQVLSAWGTGRGERPALALRIALHAWALASCLRREEAESRLQEALTGSDEFKSRDRAWLHYYAGKTYLSLGSQQRARAAFQEANTLHPYGGI